MFRYLLPGAVCISAFLGSWLIEAMFPHGDSRNGFGAMCFWGTAPFGFGYGIAALIEASRPNGVRVLVRQVPLCLVLAGGPWLILWVVVKFQLLKGHL